MSELQQNRYDRLIRRVGGIVGTGSQVSEVIHELFPMIDVEDVPAELLVLMGTRIALGQTDNAAVAANQQRSQLFNPAGSNAILTCTQISIRSSVAQAIRFGIVDVALTNLTNTRAFRDGRLPFGPAIISTVGEMRDDASAAAALVQAYLVFVPANESVVIKDDNSVAVLSPGTGLQVTTTTLNTSLTVGYLWRERPAEQSELNF